MPQPRPPSPVATAAFQSIIQRVQQTAKRSGHQGPHQVRAVAVSKTKPVSLIHRLYDVGDGENYFQELLDKAPQIIANQLDHVVTSIGRKPLKVLV